jgi:hydrogenase small subunit
MTSQMPGGEQTLEQRLAIRGVTRRSFLQFCALMTATLALPAVTAPKFTQALQASTTRLPLVWLEFQSCTGDTESFLRAGNPTASQILLETLSVNYQETLMVPAGASAEKGIRDTMAQFPQGYLAVVEGAIPTNHGGIYCTIGGRTALSIAEEVCRNSLATIALGTCAFAGGWPGAVPNTTGAKGVKDAITGIPRLINMPGCPMNVTNLTALITYYLANQAWPPMDTTGRPVFAYGADIHDNCPRKSHYKAGRFVQAWGDAGHVQGWCLFQMGCRGPRTHHNCSSVQWNEGTNWPVGAGHPCIGCSEGGFWDSLSPFYVPLPGHPD